LSKARRAGVKLPPPARGKVSEKVRRQAKRDSRPGGRVEGHRVSSRRSRATRGALHREGREAASTLAISRQARAAARRKTLSARSAAGHQAVRTKGKHRLSAAGRKAGRTRKAAGKL
jgi:hypothetical protein